MCQKLFFGTFIAQGTNFAVFLLKAIKLFITFWQIMWSRVGGHGCPPTSSETEADHSELLQRRPSSAPEGSPAVYLVVQVLPQLGSPSVLASCILSWRPPSDYPVVLNQPLAPMAPEPLYSPRANRRMNRRNRHPYRLLSLNERMERDRQILPPVLEEESAEETTREIPERRRRIIKRPGLNHSTDRRGELQIISSDERNRYPDRFTQWQADEPQIIITSDVQLQTDEIAYESTVSPQESVSASTLSSHSQDNFGRTSCLQPDTQNTVSLHEPVSGVMSSYQSSHNGYSTNNFIDRGTQISPEPHIIEIIDLDSENSESENQGPENPEILQLNAENIQVVQVVAYPEKEHNEINEPPFRSYKLYARLASISSLPAPTHASRQVANRVIRHARHYKTLDVKALHCLNCDLFPVLPVTGSCGHTRCTNCIQINGPCPCGAEAPKTLHVNTVVQNLMGKIIPNDFSRRGRANNKLRAEFSGATRATEVADSTVNTGPRAGRSRRLTSGPRSMLSRIRFALAGINERMPMSPQVQFEHAIRLMAVGRYRAAAPHLARVADSSEPFARTARITLAQIIVVLADGRDPQRIARDLFRLVRLQSAASWLRPSDLECVLCYTTYKNPVTTPCGHTYCRTCIERALDYRKVCALCLRPLEDFHLAMINETKFICAALQSIDAYTPPSPLESDIIPIFVCTVAYPSIPCPLFIFDPRYWLMIRRVLESGSRRFGMVAYERDRNYSDYGTILEVCDCVHLEDGRSILSTIGISRFRVIERDVRDGCEVARFQTLTDIMPLDEFAVVEMRVMASEVVCKALLWLQRMNKKVRQEIETAFGEIPYNERSTNDWWRSPDGPAWLWWLIAILPLRSEIKVLILSTRNLRKRFMAVARTLDAIDQAVITTTATSEYEIRSALTNADEWLERGS